MTNCQVCGNIINGVKDCGLNSDGSINYEFCSNCYREGRFTQSQEVDGFSQTVAPILLYGATQANMVSTTGENGAVLPVFFDNDESQRQ